MSQWTVQASDGVVAEIENKTSDGPGGLRLRFDFRAGSGFVVIRRKVGITLPGDYRLNTRVRYRGLANNFETKLLDPSGENVWWVNQRDYLEVDEFIWEHFKRRHFSFAWGPNGGKPHTELGAIEFAIAASNGGKGLIEFTDLTLESLPLPTVRSEAISVVGSTARLDRNEIPRILERGGGRIEWRPEAAEGEFVLDLGKAREFGGLIGQFDPSAVPTRVQVDFSTDGSTFEFADACRVGKTGKFYLPIRDAETSFIRVRVQGSPAGTNLRTLELVPLEFGANMNGAFARIASESPRGLYPRYLLGEQQYWTVVGVADDRNEALLSADGAIEVDKERFSIEPFVLRDGGELLTWANSQTTQELADGYLPLPSVTRTYPRLRLRTDTFAFGESGKSGLGAIYTVTNTSAEQAKGKLLLAIRPFQVNPPWQDLKTSGGFAAIGAVDVEDQFSGNIVHVWNRLPSEPKTVQVIGDAPEMFASISDFGDAVLRVSVGDFPVGTELAKDARLKAASGVIVCSYNLAPGEEMVRGAVVPFHGYFARPIHGGRLTEVPIDLTLPALDKLQEQAREWWRRELNRVRLSIPADRALENTFRTAQAHILINRDGPAIQPGSRTYERSWIRDGCLTSSALLATGHAERVREFIDWYAPFQYPSGKVPCVVDKRGPDPVPENDSHGQLLYLLHKYYLFTHDTATLAKNYPHVLKAVEYIESIRAQRMTPEYRDATGIKRAEYGLVPESISHEGYSAKPMHSYWDDFFIEKGLQDAADIARILEKKDDAARFQASADDFRTCLIGSIKRTTAHHKIDYIPGCVELGDFDATSTTIALWPCGAGAWLDRSQLERTFEKFYEFGMGRIDGSKKYNEYTPYEWRIVGSMIRLGWPEKAWKLADFYMADRRPMAWNQWAEVVWRDPKTPKFIGDMPHTWVASDFLNSTRAMFVYEDDATKRLVIGAGIKPAWLEGEGVSIGKWPTEFGVLTYSAKRSDRNLIVEYSFSSDLPPGGIELSPNLAMNPQCAELNGKSLDVSAKVIRLTESRGTLVVEVADH
ncbi:MAG: hypothetical protein ACREJD_05700 [Phycisphaerales bacterium]